MRLLDEYEMIVEREDQMWKLYISYEYKYFKFF